MEYSKLIAVSGKSGLFELLTSKSDGAIAKSLENDSTQFISSRAHQFSHLESIEVFTTHENVFLADVFIEMGKSKTALPDDKDAKLIQAYFKKVYPKMDFERVYPSDMKKMIKWFAQLQKHEVTPTLPEVDEEEEKA
jgi:lipase chaperone LimK